MATALAVLEYKTYTVKSSGADLRAHLCAMSDGSLQLWDGLNWYPYECVE